MNKLQAINARDRRPLYIQAISILTAMIEDGEMPIGSQLPPEGELADLLGMSRSTLREALGHLENYGMITRQQGKGTFVSAPQGKGFLGGLERLEPFREVVQRANKDHKVVERKIDFSVLYPQAQQDLKLDEGTRFNRVQVVESIDGVHCMYLEDYLVADNFNKEDMTDYKGSMLTYLIEERTPPLSFTNTKIFAVKADAYIAEKLNVEVGHPILHFKETYFDTVGQVLGIAYLYQVSEFFYFYVTRRVMPHY